MELAQNDSESCRSGRTAGEPGYPVCMTEQPSDGHDVIHLGGETGVVVPMHEYRTLKALADRASAEEIDQAETDAAIVEYEDWVAAGRPGELTHEQAMARLLTGK
jgi:hypothetical protein